MKKKWLLGVIILMIIISSLLLFLFARHSYEITVPRQGPIVEAIYGLGTIVSRKIYEVKLGILSSVKKIYATEGQLVDVHSPLINFYEGPSFKAPFKGTITAVNYRADEIVTPNVTVLRMEDITDLFLEVSLEQEGALRVKPGQPVKVVFESLRGEVLKADVESIFPRNGEFIARIEIKNLSENVLPGMTADVSIEVGKIDNALLIPLASIHAGAVNLRRNGKRIKQKVQVGHVDGLWAEITDNSILMSDEILIQKSGHR